MEVDEIAVKIDEEVEKYSKDVEDRISACLDRTADEILEYIKSNAPRSNHGSVHLADSFIKESYGEGANRIIVIYSKTKGRLVHLIEFGFKHRSGAFVSARPFLRPAYETYAPKMLEEIRGIIKGN